MTDYYAGPGGQWPTLTAAMKYIGSLGATGGMTLHMTGNLTEGVNIPRHNWITQAPQDMLVDLGGFTLTTPAGSQAALLAVGVDTQWSFRNGKIANPAGWAVQVDQSVMSFFDGIEVVMGTPTAMAAGGFLGTAGGRAQCLSRIVFSGNGGYLMSVGWDAAIMYEPATIGLDGTVTCLDLFNVGSNGKVELSSPTGVSFDGTFTYSGGRTSSDGLSGSQLVVPKGIAWPIGSTP